MLLARAFTFAHEPLGVDTDGRYVGREREVNVLAERLFFSNGGSFLVTCYRGVGKTSFVNQVIRQLHARRAWSNTSESRSMLASMIPSARAASLSSRLQTVRAASLALVALVLLNLMWDGSIPSTKLGLVDFGPFSLAAVRLLPAGALFVRVLSPAASRRLPSADRLHMAGLGV